MKQTVYKTYEKAPTSLVMDIQTMIKETQKQVTINQHYVPQFYLRQFSSSPGKIWCCEHRSERFKQRERSIERVCSSEHFYDLPATLEDESSELFQIVEKQLCAVESIGKRFIRSCLAGYEELVHQKFREEAIGRPPSRVFKNLAAYMAIQFLRTESARILVRLSLDSDTEVDLARVGSSLSHADWCVNENWIKYYHIRCISDFRDYMQYFLKPIWRFGINQSRTPLWTSDNPVSLVGPHASSTRLDFRSYGLRIAFPLSPSIVLILHEPDRFSRMKHLDGKPLKLSEHDVNTLNQAQFNQSTRFILSSAPFKDAEIATYKRKHNKRIQTIAVERMWQEKLTRVTTKTARVPKSPKK